MISITWLNKLISVTLVNCLGLYYLSEQWGIWPLWHTSVINHPSQTLFTDRTSVQLSDSLGWAHHNENKVLWEGDLRSAWSVGSVGAWVSNPNTKGRSHDGDLSFKPGPSHVCTCNELRHQEVSPSWHSSYCLMKVGYGNCIHLNSDIYSCWVQEWLRKCKKNLKRAFGSV